MRKHFVFVLLLALSPIYAGPTMTAHFIDVGQADACLLEFPCGAVLIDAGTQKDQEHKLTSYLAAFFESRPHLENTLDKIIITHNHIDHTRALREVVGMFPVNHFVESGHDRGMGTGEPNYIRRHRQTGIDVGTGRWKKPAVRQPSQLRECGRHVLYPYRNGQGKRLGTPSLHGSPYERFTSC